MNCRQVYELLERYASGQLERREQQAIEAHLAVCPSCQAEHDTLRMVRAALDNYPRIKASPDFDFRVLETVMARTANSNSLLDRLDALFARPIYKLLGASTLGIVIALLTVALVVLPHARGFKVSAPSDTAAVQPFSPFAHSHGLYAFDQLSSDFDDTDGTRAPRRAEPTPRRSRQPQRRESSWDANTPGLLYVRQSGSWC